MFLITVRVDMKVQKLFNGAFVICSSHIRQGGHQNASPLTLRLFVRIVVQRTELFQLSNR